MTKQQSFLLSLLKLGIGKGTYSDFSVDDEVNWREIFEISQEQGCAAIVFDAVNELYERGAVKGIDFQTKMKWIGAVQQTESIYAHHLDVINRLSAFYKQHEIKMILLKGVGLSYNYPKASHRPCGDIDIYLFGEQEKGDRLVQEEYNISINRDHHKHTIFLFDGVTIENHYDFANYQKHKSSKVIDEWLKEETQNSVSYGNLYLPSPNFNAIILVRHAASHFASERITLRHILDWAFFVDKYYEEVDWEQHWNVCLEQNMHQFLLSINEICVEYLGFSPSKFRTVSRNNLTERILKDIFFPSSIDGREYKGGSIKERGCRWWKNRWKHSVVYPEGLMASFFHQVLSFIKKPKTFSRHLFLLIPLFCLSLTATSSFAKNVQKKAIITQSFFKKGRKEYVIRKDFDLNGGDIKIPKGCSLLFKGGSISNGTIYLSDGVTIEGNGALCSSSFKMDKGFNIANKTFLYAEDVSDITIRNITIKGPYNQHMGNLSFRGRPLTKSEHLIYIGNCRNIFIEGINIINFYSNKVNKEWFEVYTTCQGLYPVLIHNCQNVNIQNCNQRESAGEAWNIFYSENISIDRLNFNSKYGVSFLTIMYSNNVNVRNSQFVRTTGFKYDTGNLVNIFSSNLIFENNVVEGGDFDWGNEHVNCRATKNFKHNSFVAYNVNILNNFFRGCKISNNTAVPKQGDLPNYIVKDITISRNRFENTLVGVSFGGRGGIQKSTIENNEFNSNTFENLSEKLRFQGIVAYNTCPDSLIIRDNTFHCTDSIFKYSFNGPIGAILIRNGRNVVIMNNKVQAPFGINYSGDASVNISNNNIYSYKPQRISVNNGTLVYSDNIIQYEESTRENTIVAPTHLLRCEGNRYISSAKDKIAANPL